MIVLRRERRRREDATGSIPLVQQQDHEARILIEDEVGAADGRRSLLLLFRRTIQTRSVVAILVGILVGASVLVALSATDLSGGGGGLGGMVAWRSSSRRTDNVVGFDKVATAAVATVAVTSDYSCATEVQGAGPCCVMVVRCLVHKCVTIFLCVMMVMCRNERTMKTHSRLRK